MSKKIKKESVIEPKTPIPSKLCKIRKFDIDTADYKVKETSAEDAKIWIISHPDEIRKQELVQRFGIDEHTLNSALDPDEQSRVEFEPDHVALILKKPECASHTNRFLLKVGSMGFFLFKNQLLVVLPDEDNNVFDGGNFKKIMSLHQFVLKFIGRIIGHFFEHLRAVNRISDELELQINGALENKYLFNLFSLEKTLVYYLNAIHSNSVVIMKLKYNATRIGFNLDNLEYLEDLIIENNQCYTQAEIYSSILASLMDARASIVSNNLNVLMKTLNVITIAIMVPTLVVSIFSMNVPLPIPQIESLWPFWSIIGAALISVIAFMIFWRWKKW